MSLFRAPRQNLWVIDISLARSHPINSAFIGLFFLNLFRIDIFQTFFPSMRIPSRPERLGQAACGTTDKNYHHGDTEIPPQADQPVA